MRRAGIIERHDRLSLGVGLMALAALGSVESSSKIELVWHWALKYRHGGGYINEYNTKSLN